MAEQSYNIVVSATKLEILPFLAHYAFKQEQDGIWVSDVVKCKVLITGVGMVATAFALGALLDDNSKQALNVGVCGAFDKSYHLGQLVLVTKDSLSELGAENSDSFLPITAIGLPDESIAGFEGYISPQHAIDIEGLKKAKGVTVNTVHGNIESIKNIKNRLSPDVETMEGAAFFYACNQKGVRCAQIRAVSNYVEQRDKSEWELEKAVSQLNHYLISYYQSNG